MATLRDMLLPRTALRRIPLAEAMGMQNYNVRRTLDLLERFNSHSPTLRSVNTLLAAIDSYEGLLKSFTTTLQLTEVSRQFQATMAAIDEQFILPDFAVAVRQFESSEILGTVERYGTRISDIQRAMNSMHTPWLNKLDEPGSIAGFARLQGIGHALSTMPAFGSQLTASLRVDLGDWRKKISWPTEIFDDLFARTSFYTEHGLNPALTGFPNGAFDEIIMTTGLRGTAAPVAIGYDFDPAAEEAEEELAFQRTNDAHDLLQRFETEVRKFIDERMKAVFGTDWVTQRVPGGMREEWIQKREAARKNGERERPLIVYSDFTDYEQVITRKDNWEKVFKQPFRSKLSIQESFRRLYPIRICTMHSRPITHEDELYLVVETKRIRGAMGWPPSIG